MADNDIEIKVRVDAQGAVTVLDKLGNEIEKVDRAAQTTSGGFSTFGARIISLNQALDLGQRAFSLLSGAATTAMGALSRGADVADISEAFGKLTEKAGGTADVLLNQLNEATGGTVRNFDLMRKSNELLQSGLKPDNIVTLSKAARAFAEQDGKSFDETLNQLTQSLVRGNDIFLKRKGIIIDNDAAYEKFGKTIGIAAKNLDEAGKAEALRLAVLEELGKKVEETGEIQRDAGDLIKGVLKQIGDNYDNLTARISGDEGVLAVLQAFADFMKDDLPKAIKIASGALISLGKVLTGTDESFNLGLEVIKQYAKNLPLLGLSTDNYNLSLQQVYGTLKEQELAQVKSTEAVVDALDPLNLLYGALDNVKIGAAKAGLGTEDLGKKFRKVGDDSKETVHRLDEVTFSIEEINKSIRKMNEIEFRGGQSWLDQNFGVPKVDPKEAIDWKDRGMLIASSLFDGFQAAMDSTGKERTKHIIGSLGTTIGAAIGGQQGAGIGNFAANLGISVGEAIHNFFGGDSAGTSARKEADKFFAEIFDANRLIVVIDGELAKIKDLAFGNGTGMFSDGTFDDAFEGLSDAAQGAFGGIGMAFEELLGNGEDMAGQLGAIFVNNIGGSLNNLQLLVQASGKSFEELGGIIETTFLNGEISAVQAQTALLGIQKTAEKGIPDGLGFTVEAFENMQAAGSKGGRAVIDGLQDIGHEAKELGIKDFPALIANLEASGKLSSEEIEKVFTALQAHGITTIEALANATSRDLIPVLSDLEANGVLTEALEKTAELAQTINSLPSEKNITLNVRTNISQADRNVIAQIGGQPGQSNGTPYNT